MPVSARGWHEIGGKQRMGMGMARGGLRAYTQYSHKPLCTDTKSYVRVVDADRQPTANALSFPLPVVLLTIKLYDRILRSLLPRGNNGDQLER